MATLILKTPTGEIWDMTMPEYLARTDHWSNSLLKHMSRSPRHMKYEKDNPIVPSDAMKLGTAYHVATLQPDRWDDEIIVLPADFNARRKADRELKEGLEEEHPEKTIITPEQEEKAQIMAYNTLTHPKAGALLSKGVAEQSYFAKLHDIPVKCRVDWMPEGYTSIVELKSVADAREGFFHRQVYNLRYFQAAAFYLRLVQEVTGNYNLIDYTWIACENDKTHDLIVYGAEEETLDMGRVAYERALEDLSECLALDQWLGYTRIARRLDLRGWMKKEEGYYD